MRKLTDIISETSVFLKYKRIFSALLTSILALLFEPAARPFGTRLRRVSRACPLTAIKILGGKTMKKNVNLILIFSYFTILCNVLFAEIPTTEIVKKNGGSIVLIGTFEDKILSGFGSGVIINEKGYIVTNYHVISKSDAIVVKDKNGELFTDVKILDVDKRRDLAILKIKGFDLKSCEIGNSNEIEIGMKVIAIGNPKGLENTVSEGIVSAKREMKGYWLIQTSAPISSGSSGGGLFNNDGKLIGITTSTLVDGQNLNFAVPINYVRATLEEILIAPEKYFYKSEKNIENESLLFSATYENDTYVSDETKKTSEAIIKQYNELLNIRDLYYLGSNLTYIEQHKKDFWSGGYKNPYYIDQNMFSALEKSKIIITSIKRIELKNRYLKEIIISLNDSANTFYELFDNYTNKKYQIAHSKGTIAERYLHEAGEKLKKYINEYIPELKEKLPLILKSDDIPKSNVRFGFNYALSIDDLVVVGIIEKMPAEKKLKINDKIVGYYNIGDEKVMFKNRNDFFKWLANIKPNETQILIVYREKSEIDIKIAPQEIKE